MRNYHLLVFLMVNFMTACSPSESAPKDQGQPMSGPTIPSEIEKTQVEEVVEISAFEQMFRDSGLVDIEQYVPGILVDLKYSSTDNFVKMDVYGSLDKCFLRKEAADKLKKAQELLQKEHPGFSLLVFDGARPFRVQQLMWDSLNIPFKRNYLSPPEKGSVHNYGCAVDLSIADSLGQELDMGTPFDFFGELAQPGLEWQMLSNGKLSKQQHQNRLLLRRIMKAAGFFDIRTEWWHFNAFGSETVKHRFSRLP